MDVFQLDQALIHDYEQFARSFTEIQATDIRRQVEEEYVGRRFWPEPLISLNPHFEPGDRVDVLASNGTLHPNTAAVFRTDGTPLTLHRRRPRPWQGRASLSQLGPAPASRFASSCRSSTRLSAPGLLANSAGPGPSSSTP